MRGRLSNQTASSQMRRLHELVTERSPGLPTRILHRDEPFSQRIGTALKSRRATRKPPRRLSGTEIECLISEYRSGCTLCEVASRFGIDPGTVSRILERRGVPRRYRSVSSEEMEVAIQDYRMGDTLKSIATDLGISPRTVRNALLRSGEPLRIRSRSVRT